MRDSFLGRFENSLDKMEWKVKIYFELVNF